MKDINQLLLKIKYFLGYQSDAEVQIEDLLEQTVSYYENIIGCMPGNVYCMSKDGIAIGCNKNVLAMLGLKSVSEFSGLTFEELGMLGGWSEEATNSFKTDTLEVAITGKSKLNIEEKPVRHTNGQLVDFLTHRVPLFDQNQQVVGVVGISIDITARKHMENELQKEKIKAEAANHAKTEFIMNMSHDVRTPLSGMLGLTSLLIESGDLDEEKSQYIKWLHESADQLLCMLTDVLDDVSADNINSKDLKLEHFNLRDLVDDIIQLERPSVIAKKLAFVLELKADIPENIYSDQVKIHRILLNLVSNAIKFTSKGTIHVSVSKINKCNLQFKVADTGVGIPAHCQAQVFDRFFRISPSYKGLYSGYGLGLHIAQSYANLLGGNIYFSSEENVGTTFYFELPLDVVDSDCI